MGIFDPAETNKQIDRVLEALGPGKKFMLTADADLKDKSGRVAVIVRISDDVKGYVRITKKIGQPVEGDAGMSISFLVDRGDDYMFTYYELVELLQERGRGLFSSHIAASRVFLGQEVLL